MPFMKQIYFAFNKINLIIKGTNKNVNPFEMF